MRAGTYLKRKSSFLVAVLALGAFTTGNIMGQHGWHAFWASVMGAVDDSLIVYDGTVSPVALVPDYVQWAQYGGNPAQHTFRQVPEKLLIPLPGYDVAEQSDPHRQTNTDIYSTGYMGDYDSGAEGEGSHAGVDIRMPIGTPLRSVMAGEVTIVKDDPYGFGKYIVIRHPNVPMLHHPDKTTTLYSVYAHLSAQTVVQGQLVKKGEEIGLSGMTGFATGPHLHFQLDDVSAPWHPYSPVSTSEAKLAGLTYLQAINTGFNQERGYQYTVHPLLYVQANLKAIEGKTRTIVKRPEPAKRVFKTAAELRKERLDRRLVTRNVTAPLSFSTSSASPSVAIVSAPVPDVASSSSSSSQAPVAMSETVLAQVASLDIQHPHSYKGREWVTVRITLLDANGNTLPSSALTSQLYMRTAFGGAEFDPPVLRASDFSANGTATVRVLPQGQRTVQLLVEPLGIIGPPMQYKK